MRGANLAILASALAMGGGMSNFGPTVHPCRRPEPQSEASKQHYLDRAAAKRARKAAAKAKRKDPA